MVWSENKDPERGAILDSETDSGMQYSIVPNQQYTFSEPKGYVLYRVHEDLMIPWGYVEELKDGSTAIVCGPAVACAQGFPQSAIRETIEELKIIAEKDLQNFKGTLL